MKKTLSFLALTMLLLAGCTKENIQQVSFSATIAGAEGTKALADNDGTGANATRCIMELYYGNELFYRTQTTVSNKTATFENVPLVSNRTYNVLLWADAGDSYYDASSLKAVKMVSTEYAANDDKRDAFFYSGQQVVGQRGATYSVSLKRPFAQVNVITTDAAIVKTASLYPSSVKMSYTAPTQFDLSTGSASEAKTITCSGNTYAAFDATASALTLQMDYLFADEEKTTVDISFDASQAGSGDAVHFDLTNIPHQRNYRTNIIGNFLTTNGKWEASIDPVWNTDDIDTDKTETEI